MRGPDERNGTIYPNGWNVTCGLCDDDMPSDTPYKDVFVLALRHHGWRRTNRYGWVCPECVAYLRRERA